MGRLKVFAVVFAIGFIFSFSIGCALSLPLPWNVILPVLFSLLFGIACVIRSERVRVAGVAGIAGVKEVESVGEGRKPEEKAEVKIPFKPLLLLTIAVALSFYFALGHLFSLTKPQGELNSNVLRAILVLNLMMAVYVSAPLLIVFAIARVYGWGWKELRRSEAWKSVGILYVLYFFALLILVMFFVMTKTGGEVTAGKVLLIVTGVILLTLLFVAIALAVLRLHGCGLDVEEVEMASKNSMIAQTLAIIACAYVILSFTFAEWVLTGVINWKLVLFVFGGVALFFAWDVAEVMWGRA